MQARTQTSFTTKDPIKTLLFRTPSRVTVAARTMDNSTLSYPQSQRPAADCQIWTNQGSISGYINDVQDLLQANEDVDRTELTEDGMNMDVLTRRR